MSGMVQGCTMSWFKDHVVAHQFGEGVDLSQLKSCTLSKWLAASAASAAGGRPSSARWPPVRGPKPMPELCSMTGLLPTWRNRRVAFDVCIRTWCAASTTVLSCTSAAGTVEF